MSAATCRAKEPREAEEAIKLGMGVTRKEFRLYAPTLARAMPVAPMKVLLTGATGNAGRAILRRLLEAGRGDLYGTHRSDPPPGFLAEFSGAMAEGRLRLLRQDLAELQPHQGPAVDAVIHCAARRPASRCASDPAAATRDNVEAVRRLVDWSRHQGVALFIHCSIHSVYAEARPPYREDDPVRATDLHVAAKLESEAIVSRDLEPPIRHLILRLPHFYGADLPDDGVLAAFGRAAWTGELRIAGDGRQTVCFMELRDLADLMASLLEAPPPSGIYNAAGETIEVRALARLFHKVQLERGRPEPSLRFEGGTAPPGYGLDCGKLFASSPWRPRQRLEAWIRNSTPSL